MLIVCILIGFLFGSYNPPPRSGAVSHGSAAVSEVDVVCLMSEADLTPLITTVDLVELTTEVDLGWLYCGHSVNAEKNENLDS